MSGGVAPYLLPDPEALALGPWQVDPGIGPGLLQSFLPDWDPSTDLRLTRTARVDVDRVRHEADLAPDAGLMVVVEWSSSTARITGCAYRGRVVNADPITVTALVDGSRLGGTLTLTTRLVLADDHLSGQEFTARHAGEVLFEEGVQTQLEGNAGRFPIYVVDFGEAGFDRDARWHLELPRALDEPVHGGIKVYLNQADKEVVAAAANAHSPTPMQRRLLDWMHTDLACRLVDAALRPDWRDHLDDHRDDADSVGASFAALVRVVFPDDSPASAAAMRDDQPSRFHSRVQGAVRRMLDNRDDALPQAV